MKIIIDPYRGGQDTGKNINGQYEKNILLDISKYMANQFEKKGIDAELVRTTDVSLTDDERNSIINEIKNSNDLIIQNRLSEDSEFDIIYPLRSNDELASIISQNLESNGINVNKYFQRRLPTNTMLDYYNVIRNTTPNETIIIEYLTLDNYQNIVDIIVDATISYINKSSPHTVVKGDSLYQIAKKYNTTVDEIKKINNLTTNSLSIGQILKIPSKETPQPPSTTSVIHTVVKGDSLYQLSKKYNTTIDAIKKLNNLTTNSLSIGQTLKIPSKEAPQPPSTTYIIHTVVKGDSLYQLAKKYNTTVDEIKKLNNLTTNTLSINETLKIPNNQEEYTIYTVVKGDSLYQIAKKYNTTVDEIKKLNNLTSNTLNINQKLKIPR